MENWPIGTRVITPPIRGESVETVTTCRPFGWSGLLLVTLAGRIGVWECRLLRVAPPAAPEA